MNMHPAATTPHCFYHGLFEVCLVLTTESALGQFILLTTAIYHTYVV
jgi:hypothetical protein